MARFNVGDRVLVTGLGECEVLGVREEWACVQSTPGAWPVVRPLSDLKPMPPPDPRDAVVEAAVAWVEFWDPFRSGPPAATSALRPIYDAVQAWKAAQ